jgi:hypothetical protein
MVRWAHGDGVIGRLPSFSLSSYDPITHHLSPSFHWGILRRTMREIRLDALVSRVETETQTQTAAVPGHTPDIGESPDGSDPFQLPPDIERIDLSDPEYREHAFERYEEMRARCPVSRAIISSGQGGADEQAIFNRPLWLVTDYEEGSRALLDRAITVEMTSVLTPEQLAQMPETPPEFQPLTRNILNLDPPEHTRLRKLV